ncbi:hypothetical protein SH528x_002373 [Novipirellula sp. SH528]|uniref:hypothetical protein n=1 Tax=Novipirellula sp. SH528 TaxID=3454466 RepID=UPI003F9EC677
MNRWLLISSLAGLLFTTTGCLHHGVRGGCQSCGTPSCSTGNCGSGGTGLLGRIGSRHSGCQSCGESCGGNCGGRPGIVGRLTGQGQCGPGGCSAGGCGRTGCVAGPLGWQQGGLDYSSHLQPGLFGHRAAAQAQAQPTNPGPPSGQVGYPYYSHHGPRDFLLDNPPTIGR